MIRLLALLLFIPTFLLRPSSGTDNVLFRFHLVGGGFGPRAGVIADSHGDLFGTTFDGGVHGGAGVVYELAPPSAPGGLWIEKIIHGFAYDGESQGIGPYGGLVGDAHGDLFGTTWLGGASGAGIVFALTPSSGNGPWTFTDLHDFPTTGVDGSSPEASLAMDGSGDLFGTTASGGTGACFGGCGIVFELSFLDGAWRESILHDFPAHGRGENASGGTLAGVIVDASGNVYGTTMEDGHGLGTVFELSPLGSGKWSYRAIYTFSGEPDGATPASDLTFGPNGSLYGTTRQGGVAGCEFGGCGTVFRLTPQAGGRWRHETLYAFRGNGDGDAPDGGVIIGGNGTIYGSTPSGGSGMTCSHIACGVAYALMPPAPGHGRWTEAVLHTFRGNGDGSIPVGDVTFGPNGAVFGATQFGGISNCSDGFGCGTVWSVAP